MRHYHRVNYRHLNDSERYRDYEYLGDDGWVGPNERVPHGAFDEYEPRQTFERSERDDDDRGYARPRALTHRLEYPREGFAVDEHSQHPRPSDARRQRPLAQARARAEGGLRDVTDAIRHPGSFVRRMVSGIFHGKGPKNWVRSDTRIHDEVCELLARHHDIDATDIEVEVKNGEVTLIGAVPDRRTKRLAEEVLDEVVGVHDVHNRLTVGGASPSTREPAKTNGNGARQEARR